MIAKMENKIKTYWLACSIKILSSLKLRQNSWNTRLLWRRLAFSQWWSTRRLAHLNSKCISCPQWAPSRKPSSNSPYLPLMINKLKLRVRKIIEIKTSRSSIKIWANLAPQINLERSKLATVWPAAPSTSHLLLSCQLTRTWRLSRTFSGATRLTQSLSTAKTIAHRVMTQILFSARNFLCRVRLYRRIIRIITISKESKTVRKVASRAIITVLLGISSCELRLANRHWNHQLGRPAASCKTIVVAKITRPARQLFQFQEKLKKVFIQRIIFKEHRFPMTFKIIARWISELHRTQA